MSKPENNTRDQPHFTFIWTIDNVYEPCFIISPKFTVKELLMTQFVIVMKVKDGNFIELYLERIRSNFEPKRLEIKFELSFLGIYGLPRIKDGKECDIIKPNIVGFPKFAYKQDVFFGRRAVFMPKHALTVRCRMWKIGTKVPDPDVCFARTLLRRDHYFFVWTIEEFSTLKKDQSRKIVLNTTAFNEMTLRLFLSENDGEEYVSIVSDYKVQGNVKYCFMKLCLLDDEGKIVHSEEKFGYFCADIQFEEFFQRRRLLENKKSLLSNDIMSLKCEILTKPEVVSNIIDNYRYLHRMGYGVISTNEGEVLRFEHDYASVRTSFLKKKMKHLLEKGTFSDVSLQTKTKSFPAHKCILSSRSRVFEAMFTRDMKEKTSDSVEISDVDEDTMKELLSYIYTDTLKILSCRTAIHIFTAADKYELLDLKRICSNFLKSDISSATVCALFDVADMHHDQELRGAAEEFLAHQGQEFLDSKTWRSFRETNPALAMDVLEQIQCKRRQL